MISNMILKRQIYHNNEHFHDLVILLYITTDFDLIVRILWGQFARTRCFYT